MNNEIAEHTEAIYPSIVFKVKGSLFSVNSRYIATLMQLPQYETLVNTAPEITGIFSYRGDIIQMFDLRIAFDMPSLMDEYQSFEQMIDARKEDHIHWVQELERSSTAGEPFTLATDPHQCAFGKWYDHFKSENQTVNFHLRKIDEPHKQLHLAALEVSRCARNCESCTRKECLKNVLARVKDQSMPKVLHLLEETKEIFRSAVYHEMVLVLSDARLGLVADEILSVEELEYADQDNRLHSLRTSPYISHVAKSQKTPGIILELDVPAIINSVQPHELDIPV